MLTAKTEIVSQVRGNGLLDDYVLDLLERVESDINKSRERKKAYSLTNLPKTFDVPYLDKKTARNRVYYNLIRRVEAKGYNVSIVYSGKKCALCKKPTKKKSCCSKSMFIVKDIYLCVSFKNKDDIEEDENISAYLKERSIFH